MNALKLARLFSQDLGKHGITPWPLDPPHILSNSLGGGQGWDLWPQLVSHPLQSTAKGATMSPESSGRDPSLFLLRNLLPSILGSHLGIVGRKAKGDQEPCSASKLLRALRHPIMWLVNRLLPFSFPFIFSLLPHLHFIPLYSFLLLS